MEEKDSKPIHFTALKKLNFPKFGKVITEKAKALRVLKKISNIYEYLINNIDCEN